jgi:uncharacterized protein (DUF1697 family)
VARHAALLRGINVGSARRISMPDLREALAAAGYPEARTYVQSGNVVLDSDDSEDGVAAAIEDVLADRFGLDDVPVIVRSRDALARVVALNPLAEIATELKRYQVNFLSATLTPEIAGQLAAAEVAPEVVAVDGREVYAWHPDGIQRSKLAALLTDRRLGVTVTARNWRTVTTVLSMMDE